MTKFLILYNAPASAAEMMANATPEQTQAGMEAWMAWAQKNGDSIVDLGVPLGSSMRVEPGSTSPGSTQASGYSILQADSLDQAAKTLQDHPHLDTPGGTIDVLEGDDASSVPGHVPLTWCRERVITKGIATEVHGSFVVVGAATTIATLRSVFAARVVHYKLAELDAAAIRISAPRAFTQEISSFIEAQRDEDGQAYAGIFYLSKLGDDVENWAIFEQQWMQGQSPMLSVERETVDPDDDDLRHACETLGLELAD